MEFTKAQAKGRGEFSSLTGENIKPQNSCQNCQFWSHASTAGTNKGNEPRDKERRTESDEAESPGIEEEQQSCARLPLTDRETKENCKSWNLRTA